MNSGSHFKKNGIEGVGRGIKKPGQTPVKALALHRLLLSIAGGLKQVNGD